MLASLALAIALPGTSAAGTVSTQSFRASAPRFASAKYLGRPLDQNFEPLRGARGTTLFPDASPSRHERHELDYEFLQVDDMLVLKANASAWGGIVSVKASAATSKRYLSFRAWDIAFVEEIDPTVAMADVPDGAAFYIERIYYGSLYEVVFYGDAQRFHAGIAGGLRGLLSVGFEAFKYKDRVDYKIRGLGFKRRPEESPVLSGNPQDILDKYVPADQPVPIFVEYRALRGAPESSPIAWVQPVTATVRFDTIAVFKDGSDGMDTWSLQARCSVNHAPVVDGEPIWTAKRNIQDSCFEAPVKGPGGESRACAYPLDWDETFTLAPGDVLECGLDGTAHDHRRPIRYDSFKLKIGEHNRNESGTFGRSAGATSYLVRYYVEFDENVASTAVPPSPAPTPPAPASSPPSAGRPSRPASPPPPPRAATATGVYRVNWAEKSKNKCRAESPRGMEIAVSQSGQAITVRLGTLGAAFELSGPIGENGQFNAFSETRTRLTRWGEVTTAVRLEGIARGDQLTATLKIKTPQCGTIFSVTARRLQ